MKTVEEIVSEIKRLKIQGATNVGITVLESLESLIKESPETPLPALEQFAAQLAYARPTEPLAQNAVRYLFSESGASLINKIHEYRRFIDEGKRSIARNAQGLIVNGGVYLTLCHSGTTVGLFEQAWKSGKRFSVYVAETRPLFQGRVTASELLKLGIDDVTMIIDDVAVSLIEGRKGKIDAVFIGADLLSSTGFVNKVGSLAVTAAAARKNIPVYSLSTLLKFDPRVFDPSIIETRSPLEIWDNPPPKLHFYSPAFDYVPYLSNVKVICETGIIDGTQVKPAVMQKFPFVNQNSNQA